MNSDCFDQLTDSQLQAAYAAQARQAISMHSGRIRQLIEHGRSPEEGWDEATIELLVQNLALMDSNNYLGCAQLGEREARFASDLVRRRHFRMGHGIGRSGDITAQQPKAAGSTLLARLTNSMVLHVLRASGAPSTRACFVVPTATGMAIVLCMLAFRAQKPNARYVIWSRIDQKTCYKSIITAGLIPIVVEPLLIETPSKIMLECCAASVSNATCNERSNLILNSVTDISSGFSSCETPNNGCIDRAYSNADNADAAIGKSGSTPAAVSTICVASAAASGSSATAAVRSPATILKTDVAQIRAHIQRVGAENVVCVLSTTSCFAPRSPDDIRATAVVCAELGVAHLVNNAYGVQSTKCMSRLEAAGGINGAGRVDAYVQSTDKNFMVPVGGAIVAGFDTTVVQAIAKTYPGRGSASPSLDVFITLLSLGMRGYKELCKQRRGTFAYLVERLDAVATAHGLLVLRAPGNDISVGLTLDPHILDDKMKTSIQAKDAVDAAVCRCKSVSDSDVDECSESTKPINMAISSAITEIGSMLFTRFVFGTRVVVGGGDPRRPPPTTVADRVFEGWGSHCSSYPYSYLTAAVGLGTTMEDVDLFVSKLDKILLSWKQRTYRLHSCLGKTDDDCQTR